MKEVMTSSISVEVVVGKIDKLNKHLNKIQLKRRRDISKNNIQLR